MQAIPPVLSAATLNKLAEAVVAAEKGDDAAADALRDFLLALVETSPAALILYMKLFIRGTQRVLEDEWQRVRLVREANDAMKDPPRRVKLQIAYCKKLRVDAVYDEDKGKWAGLIVRQRKSRHQVLAATAAKYQFPQTAQDAAQALLDRVREEMWKGLSSPEIDQQIEKYTDV